MTRKEGSVWAFRIMLAIHDNPFRRKYFDPYKILKNAGLKPGQKVLEVGCGPGFFTIPAARILTNTGIIYAVDIHRLAIKRVQNKIQKEELVNINTILTDATSTDLSDQSIDLAFLFGLPRLIHNEKVFTSF